MRMSLVESMKHWPFFSTSALDKHNVTGVFQIRNTSQLLLLIYWLILVYHDVEATNKFIVSESSGILYFIINSSSLLI